MAQAAGPEVRRQEREVGATGVQFIGGFGRSLFSSVLYNLEDYNPKLRGSELMSVLDTMRLSDGEIASSLSRIEMPLVSASWRFEPDEDDPDGEEKAEFCEKWIMGVGRTDPWALRWKEFLRHALLMLPFGFSAFEKVWGVDGQNRQVYAKIAPRLPKTVQEFRFGRDGRLESMMQRAYKVGEGYVEAVIPAEKLVVFTFAREGDNYWGRSILRGCYKAWYHKSGFEVLDGIAKERNGVGLTVVTIPRNAADDVKQNAEKVSREARAHERQGFVLEEGMTLDVKFPTGSPPDIIGSIKYHDSQISQTLFSEFMHLGASESGSRSTAETKVDLLLVALQGVAGLIEDVVNQQLVPDLVDRNWGGSEYRRPELRCEDLNKMSGTVLADVAAKLAQVQLITPDTELEAHLREELRLPQKPKDLVAAQEAATKAGLEMAARGGAPEGGPRPGEADGSGQKTTDASPQAEEEDEGDEVKAATEPRRLVEPVSLGRDPLPHERYCAFTDMKRYLVKAPRRTWSEVVAPIREDMIRQLAKSAASASDSDLAAGQIGRPYQAKMSSALQDPFLRAYLRGRAAVLEERSRAASKSAVTMAEDAEDEYDVEPTKAQRDWISKLVQGFVSLQVLGPLVAEASRAGLAARNADMGASEQARYVAEALGDLSVPAAQAKLAGEMTRVFTNGRDEQAAEMSGEIESYFYSAIMDEGTCGSCSEKDGDEHGAGDPFYATPNPDCEGGANCRCVTVYVWKEEAA